jgi:hypothetical protein
MGGRPVSLAEIRHSILFHAMLKDLAFILWVMKYHWLIQAVTKISNKYKMRLKRVIFSTWPNALPPRAQPYPQKDS